MAMPHSPSCYEKVINLRGAVLPIIDLCPSRYEAD